MEGATIRKNVHFSKKNHLTKAMAPLDIHGMCSRLK